MDFNITRLLKFKSVKRPLFGLLICPAYEKSLSTGAEEGNGVLNLINICLINHYYEFVLCCYYPILEINQVDILYKYFHFFQIEKNCSRHQYLHCYLH